MLEYGKSRPGMEILRSASSYLRILVNFLVDVAVAWWMHVSASLAIYLWVSCNLSEHESVYTI